MTIKEERKKYELTDDVLEMISGGNEYAMPTPSDEAPTDRAELEPLNDYRDINEM